MTLRNRLSLLFLSFLFLVAISAAATARMLYDQEQDALVINLAGRQRMLAQQAISQALQLHSSPNPAEHRQILREAEAIFDQALTALIAGGETSYLPGQVVDLPATRTDSIQAELRALQRVWTAFQGDLRVIETAPSSSASMNSALRSLQALSPQLAQLADDIVRLYEAESERKLARLQWVQAGFFLCAAALLAAGVIMVQRAIMNPLRILEGAAEQIGQGDLGSPVQLTGPPEFASLAASVDAMRIQLRTMADGLEARVSQRTRELTALYEVICEISSHLEIERVLQSVIRKARSLIESDVAFLCLLDMQNETLVFTAHDGPPDAVCGGCTLATLGTGRTCVPSATVCSQSMVQAL